MGYNCCFFLNVVPLHIESPYNFGGTGPILRVKNQYHSGKWVIEEYPGMFDPYSGITNNLSESMNAVLKQENDWK
jgi:hypothetical protein